MRNIKLWDYAYLGVKSDYDKKLQYLENLAEHEKWHSGQNKDFDILSNYLENTFNKCSEDNLIATNEDGSVSAINTGLLTELGEEIFMIFTKNGIPGHQEWYFNGFNKKSDNIMMSFIDEIQYPSFFKDFNDVFFNPAFEIVPNLDHIITDNKERIDEIMHDVPFYNSIPISGLCALLNGEILNTQKRVKRNQRMAVPMYYKEKVQFLLPIKMYNKIIPLVVDQVGNRYRGVTILNRQMAYKNARLIMKPETNWILP
ncbi:MAG: DUF3825 domain-containing protein [Bacilli bacterium]|nr:DUF3825 domain-containing protein [Bacilli bacterium]